MYDIDAGRSHALRLDSPRALSADEEIAAIEKQMEALSLRHCELMEAKRVAFAQSRPIPASKDSVQNLLGQIARATGLANVEVMSYIATGSFAPNLTADNDFWTRRHRVLSGTTPMIARSAGHIDRMTAAATGEIEDPAAGLRRERN